jgi:hypothetical protein
MKVLVAMRVPDTDVRDVIQVHRRYLVELMQQWTRIKEAEAGADLNLALVVDAELFRLDAVVRWLDTADGRIKRAAADAPEPAADLASPPGAPSTQRAPSAQGAPSPPGAANTPGQGGTTSQAPPSLPRLRRRAAVGRGPKP